MSSPSYFCLLTILPVEKYNEWNNTYFTFKNEKNARFADKLFYSYRIK